MGLLDVQENCDPVFADGRAHYSSFIHQRIVAIRVAAAGSGAFARWLESYSGELQRLTIERHATSDGCDLG